MKYRKKPVVIDAVQFNHGCQDVLLDHLEGCYGWHGVENGIIIPTPEGDMLASPGDWIIKGVNGEFYPCKPDIFKATYEPVMCHESTPSTDRPSFYEKRMGEA